MKEGTRGATRYEFTLAVTGEERLLPWEKMQAENLAHAVLWNVCEPSREDWLGLTDPERTLLGLVRAPSGEPAAALWVIPSGLCGTVHFVVFRAFRADAVNMGRQALRWLFDTWPFAALAAVFPAAYRHLPPFIETLGFRLWPEVFPSACPMPTKTHPARCSDMRFALLCRSDAAG